MAKKPNKTKTKSSSKSASSAVDIASVVKDIKQSIKSYQDDMLKQNKQTNKEMMDFNSAEAKKARDWETQMSNTSHQREVKDLRAAGLNPVLSANSGANAYNTQSASASLDSPSTAMASMFSAMLSGMSNIYSSAISGQATTKAANTSARAQTDSAKTSAEAQKYAADKSYASSLYKTNKDYQAAIYQANKNYEAVMNKPVNNLIQLLDKYLFGDKKNKDTTQVGKAEKKIIKWLKKMPSADKDYVKVSHTKDGHRLVDYSDDLYDWACRAVNDLLGAYYAKPGDGYTYTIVIDYLAMIKRGSPKDFQNFNKSFKNAKKQIEYYKNKK